MAGWIVRMLAVWSWLLILPAIGLLVLGVSLIVASMVPPSGLGAALAAGILGFFGGLIVAIFFVAASVIGISSWVDRQWNTHGNAGRVAPTILAASWIAPAIFVLPVAIAALGNPRGDFYSIVGLVVLAPPATASLTLLALLHWPRPVMSAKMTV